MTSNYYWRWADPQYGHMGWSTTRGHDDTTIKEEERNKRVHLALITKLSTRVLMGNSSEI